MPTILIPVFTRQRFIAAATLAALVVVGGVRYLRPWSHRKYPFGADVPAVLRRFTQLISYAFWREFAMSKHFFSTLFRPSLQASAIGVLMVSVLAGCAAIPSLPSPSQIKVPDQYQTAASFSAPETAWPKDEWWRAYGDPQLDALIDEALRDSPTLAIAQARLRQSEAVSQIAGATRLPEVSGNLSLTEEKQSYNYLIPKAAVPQGWNDYGQATLNFSWELDFWGKNRSALAAAISEQKAAQAEVAQTRLILATSVASAYAELAHSYTVRDTAEAALAVRTKTVELFRERYQSELETLGSVRQVEARQAAAQAALQAVDERIALQKNGIAALLGAGPDRGLAIARPAVHFANSTGLPPHLALDLLGRRPDIVAARWRTEAAAHLIDQRKAGFYPSVNLLAYVGYQSLEIDKLTKSGSRFGGVGPAISLPIFNTERLQGQLRGAHAEYDAAVLSYNAALSNALREVADAAVSRKALDGQLESLRASVAAAGDAHRIANNRYRGELSTYLDVLTAEDALLSAQRALADMETRALVLDVDLVRTLGGGFQQSNDPTNTRMNTARK
jgi:NodT family efflux transporter outer membrane factor (OMF) lipoprotein